MMNRLVTLLAVGALSIAPALYGQADRPDAQKRDPQQQADRPGSGAAQTVTGCLTEQQGTYTIATQSGESYSVTGSADLVKHKDHTVKLTGTASDEGGKKMLTVSKIEHVSPSCSK